MVTVNVTVYSYFVRVKCTSCVRLNLFQAINEKINFSYHISGVLKDTNMWFLLLQAALN